MDDVPNKPCSLTHVLFALHMACSDLYRTILFFLIGDLNEIFKKPVNFYNGERIWSK